MSIATQVLTRHSVTTKPAPLLQDVFNIHVAQVNLLSNATLEALLKEVIPCIQTDKSAFGVMAVLPTCNWQVTSRTPANALVSQISTERWSARTVKTSLDWIVLQTPAAPRCGSSALHMSPALLACSCRQVHFRTRMWAVKVSSSCHTKLII
jgi:hypothetical protein